MRLFVAASLGPEVIAAAQSVIEELRQRVTALDASARITWIPAPLMHLTIRFIGEVPEERLDLITSVMAPPIPAAPFPLSVAGVGTFSSHGVPRVIWGGLAHGAAELRRVERHVTARLQSIGIPPDEREFSPHLTFGRVRDGRGLKTAALVHGFETRPLGTAAIDAITLFQSQSSPKGPTYVPLLRTRLHV